MTSVSSITAYCEEHGLGADECVSQMRQAVFEETGLTVSAGIAPNKVCFLFCVFFISLSFFDHLLSGMLNDSSINNQMLAKVSTSISRQSSHSDDPSVSRSAQTKYVMMHISSTFHDLPIEHVCILEQTQRAIPPPVRRPIYPRVHARSLHPQDPRYRPSQRTAPRFHRHKSKTTS